MYIFDLSRHWPSIKLTTLWLSSVTDNDLCSWSCDNNWHVSTVILQDGEEIFIRCLTIIIIKDINIMAHTNVSNTKHQWNVNHSNIVTARDWKEHNQYWSYIWLIPAVPSSVVALIVNGLGEPPGKFTTTTHRVTTPVTSVVV